MFLSLHRQIGWTHRHAGIGFTNVDDRRVKLFFLPESVGHHAAGERQAYGYGRGAGYFGSSRCRGRGHVVVAVVCYALRGG